MKKVIFNYGYGEKFCFTLRQNWIDFEVFTQRGEGGTDEEIWIREYYEMILKDDVIDFFALGVLACRGFSIKQGKSEFTMEAFGDEEVDITGETYIQLIKMFAELAKVL